MDFYEFSEVTWYTFPEITYNVFIGLEASIQKSRDWGKNDSDMFHL